jgi:type II secretion system protein C
MNFSFDDLTELIQRNAPAIGLGLGVLLLILVATKVTLDTLDKRTIKQKDYAPQNVTPLTQKTSDRGIRSEIVKRANLFGNAAPAVLVNAPKTTLNLTLLGIFSSNSPAYARAIIQAGRSSSKLYSVGDDIQGAGAKLEEIRPHEVLLNRSGAIESLPLNKVGSMKGATITFNAPPTPPDLNPGSTTVASFSNNSDGNQASNGLPSGTSNAEIKEDSPNGPRRKIKRPSFSGLDRAIQKADDI